MAAAAGNNTAKKRKSDGSPRNVADKSSSDTATFLNDPLLLRRLSSAASLTHSFLQSNDLILPPSHSLRLESLVPISPPPTNLPSAAADTWFNRFLPSAVEDDDPRWRLCFRMSRSAFFNLFSILLSPSLPSFAATIFRLAHSASYESLVNRFGFDSTADACRAFFTVCKLIHEKLGQLNNPKPDLSPQLLPNCCGVLGFDRFEVDGELLGVNGSLIAQALVDSDGRFVDISAGWPSTMKPEAIFRQTKLFSTVDETEATRLLLNGISVPRYVLGDSCFPPLPWLMTPYNSSSNDEDESSSSREFDNVIRNALRSVECAFAKVRARWLILDRKWKPETVEFLPFILTATCLLHNFLVDYGEDELVKCGARAETWKNEKEEEETRRFQGEAFVGSKKIRDAIAENLSQVSSVR